MGDQGMKSILLRRVLPTTARTWELSHCPNSVPPISELGLAGPLPGSLYDPGPAATAFAPGAEQGLGFLQPVPEEGLMGWGQTRDPISKEGKEGLGWWDLARQRKEGPLQAAEKEPSLGGREWT